MGMCGNLAAGIAMKEAVVQLLNELPYDRLHDVTSQNTTTTYTSGMKVAKLVVYHFQLPYLSKLSRSKLALLTKLKLET